MGCDGLEAEDQVPGVLVRVTRTCHVRLNRG